MNICNLGRISYRKALNIQNQLVDLVQRKAILNTILICEHYPVYTFGRRQNLDDSLSAIADTVKVQRGGQTTYHGPGQLVLYPIVNLQSLHLGVKDYVHRLEEIVIKTLKMHGIYGHRSSTNGVFVNNNKISAVGVHVQRFVTSHGLSLNVNKTVLPWFKRIVPCGLRNIETTCIESILNKEISLSLIEAQLIQNLESDWNVKGNHLTLETLLDDDICINPLFNPMMPGNLISNQFEDDDDEGW